MTNIINYIKNIYILKKLSKSTLNIIDINKQIENYKNKLIKEKKWFSLFLLEFIKNFYSNIEFILNILLYIFTILKKNKEYMKVIYLNIKKMAKYINIPLEYIIDHIFKPNIYERDIKLLTYTVIKIIEYILMSFISVTIVRPVTLRN